MQGVIPFKWSSHCIFHYNTCNRHCSTKLQQNCNMLGWHAPSLSRRAFDHSQPIDQGGLLTCLHLSLQVKSIMVSAVSQMLTQDLNTFRVLDISDPHHLVATSNLRGFLNTSILPHPSNIVNFGGTIQLTPISRNLGGLLNNP